MHVSALSPGNCASSCSRLTSNVRLATRGVVWTWRPACPCRPWLPTAAPRHPPRSRHRKWLCLTEQITPLCQELCVHIYLLRGVWGWWWWEVSLSLPLCFSEDEKLFESLVCEEARSVKIVPRLGLVVIFMFGLLGVNVRLFGRVLLAVRKVVACCWKSS